MGRKKRYTGLYGMPFGGAFGGAYGGGGGAGAGYGASSAPLFGASSAPTLGSLLAAPEPAGPDVPELPEHKVVGVTFNNRQAALGTVHDGDHVLLVPCQNPYDAQAVAVRKLDGTMLGYLARGTTGPYLAGIYLARVSGSGSMFGGFDEETETIDETRWLRIQMVSMEPVWAGAHLKTPFDRSE